LVREALFFFAGTVFFLIYLMGAYAALEAISRALLGTPVPTPAEEYWLLENFFPFAILGLYLGARISVAILRRLVARQPRQREPIAQRRWSTVVRTIAALFFLLGSAPLVLMQISRPDPLGREGTLAIFYTVFGAFVLVAAALFLAASALECLEKRAVEKQK
jgi:hypothetical protein